MDGEEFISKFREMVDDSLDEDYEYQLLNDAKDEVEAELAWEQLLKEQAYPVSAGYSFATALGVLPTRFISPVRMVEDTSDGDYEKVDFADRAMKANASFGYFIDLAGGNIHLSGSNHAAKTMYLYYTQSSADITEDSTWSFPERFHSILPLKMAELYYLSDAGEKSRSWDKEWATQYQRKLGQMVTWNDKLKLANRRPRRTARALSPRAVY